MSYGVTDYSAASIKIAEKKQNDNQNNDSRLNSLKNVTINQQSILSIVRQFLSMTECFKLRSVNHTWKFDQNNYLYRELKNISNINEFNIIRTEFKIYPINLRLESIDFNCAHCQIGQAHPDSEDKSHLEGSSYFMLFYTIPSQHVLDVGPPIPDSNMKFGFTQRLSTGSRISQAFLPKLLNLFPNLTELNLKGLKNFKIEKVDGPFKFPKITSLILNGCLEDSINISGIANIFYRFKNLTHMDLSNCNLQNVSTYLRDTISSLHFDSDKLLSLNLSRTQIEDLKLIYLPAIRFINLTSLDISYCSRIPEKDIVNLLPQLPKLTELKAYGTSVTEETILFIANKMPKIQTIKPHQQLLRNYRKTLAYEPKSPFGLFYKIVLANSNPAEAQDVIETIFQQLNQAIKVQLLHTATPQVDLRGKKNIDPAFLFQCKKLVRLVQGVILDRYNMFIETDQETSYRSHLERKSSLESLTSKGDQLHQIIHALSGSPTTTNSIEWGRKNAKANFCLLADALEEASKLKYLHH